MHTTIFRIVGRDAGRYAVLSSVSLTIALSIILISVGVPQGLTLAFAVLAPGAGLALLWSAFFRSVPEKVRTHVDEQLASTHRHYETPWPKEWKKALRFYHDYQGVTEEEREIFLTLLSDGGGWKAGDPQNFLDAARSISGVAT